MAIRQDPTDREQMSLLNEITMAHTVLMPGRLRDGWSTLRRQRRTVQTLFEIWLPWWPWDTHYSLPRLDMDKSPSPMYMMRLLEANQVVGCAPATATLSTHSADFAAALPSDQKKKKPTLSSGSQFMTWKAQVLRNLRLEPVVKSAPDAFEISQEHAQGGRLKPPLVTDNTSLPIHATTSAERRRTCSHQLLATAPP